MNLRTAYIADWVRHSAFNGKCNMHDQPMVLDNKSVQSMTVDPSGSLTVVRETREGELVSWLFPAGTWHGEPIQEQESKSRKGRKESLEFNG